MLKEIEEILKGNLNEFKIKKNPEIKYESLLNKIEKLNKPFPSFNCKGYVIDLSFLKDEKQSLNQLNNIIKENENFVNDLTNIFLDIEEEKKQKKKREEEEKKREIEKIIERKKKGDQLCDDFLDSLTKIIKINLNEEEIFNETNLEKPSIDDVLGVISDITGNNDMNSKSKEQTKQDSFDNILNKVRKPLDFLNFMENNYDKYKDNTEKLDLTPLKTYKESHEIRIDVLEIMEKKDISKFMEEIKKNNEIINQFLIDNSFTTLYAASNIGNIHRLEFQKKSNTPPILGKCNEILCFDNYQDYIIAGHSNGYISIIFKGFTIETILDEKKSPIIAIKIIKFFKKKNKEKIEFLYSNKEGQINLIIRAKGIFNKKKCVNILQNSSPIYNIISYNPDQDLSISKKKRMYFGFVGINNLIFMKLKPLPINEEERNK